MITLQQALRRSALDQFTSPPPRKKHRVTIDRAPQVDQLNGFRVGMEVITSKRPQCGSVTGRIASIVLPAMMAPFAVVVDAEGGSHAVDLSEL